MMKNKGAAVGTAIRDMSYYCLRILAAQRTKRNGRLRAGSAATVVSTASALVFVAATAPLPLSTCGDGQPSKQEQDCQVRRRDAATDVHNAITMTRLGKRHPSDSGPAAQSSCIAARIRSAEGLDGRAEWNELLQARSDLLTRWNLLRRERTTTLCEQGGSRPSSSDHPHPESGDSYVLVAGQQLQQHRKFTESLAQQQQHQRQEQCQQKVVEEGSARIQIALHDSSLRQNQPPLSAEKGETDYKGDDAYPNFSRHGRNAPLPAYLTPAVYDALRGLRTPKGVTLEDCIRGGVSLPHGARPPRGLAGVYAGDEHSYRVFRDLFDPLIREYHQPSNSSSSSMSGSARQWQQPSARQSQKDRDRKERRSTLPSSSTMGRLQRHMTNLNYSQLVQDTLDPEGEYILYTRLRLARSISGFRFPPCIRRGERRQVERLFQDAVSDWPGRYVPIMSMSNSQHDHLIQQQLLFKDPDDFLLSAGFGRDWPDARGIYCDNWQGDAPSIIIWCNAEDHLWIISHGKGGNVQGVFTELSKAVSRLETALKARGRHFVEDAKYGFLNASPANIGTALRASVYVKLVRLSRQPGFSDLVSRLRLEARSDYSHSDRRFTGISEIANAEALGKSEVDLINIMIRGVGFLIELEKRLERGEEVDLDAVELPTGC